MGHRLQHWEVIWRDAPGAFGFLTGEWGFEGLERIERGVAYHKIGLHVRVEFIASNNEAEFHTQLERGSTDSGNRDRPVTLGCMHWACGLGTAAAPTTATWSAHTIAKRVSQHAAALRRVMPHVDGPDAVELFGGCQSNRI